MNRFRIIAAVLLTLIAQLLLIPSAVAVEANYLWALTAGSGYVNGKTFSEAKTYCSSQGGTIASKNQLVDANKKGFSMCAYGWLESGITGYVMTGTHRGCGKNGFNGGVAQAQGKKLASYCVGPKAPANTKQVQLREAPQDYTVAAPNSDEYIVNSKLAASFDPKKYYYLSNKWLGSNKVLAIDEQKKLVMRDKSPSDNVGQLWKIIHEKNGSVRLHNASLGMDYGVDSDASAPNISKVGSYTGQYWYFTSDNNGWFRISNSFQGKHKVLDTHPAANNPLFFEAASKKTLGTYWQYQEASSINTSAKVTYETISVDTTPSPSPEQKPSNITIAGCTNSDICDEMFTNATNAFSSESNDFSKAYACSKISSESLILKSDSKSIFRSNLCIKERSTSKSLDMLQTTYSEFKVIDRWFYYIEKDFLTGIKSNPKSVLDYSSKLLRDRLQMGKGVPITYLEAYVFTEVLNVVAKEPSKRSIAESVVANWVVRGLLAKDYQDWRNAKSEYFDWYKHPCIYTPPALFVENFEKTHGSNRGHACSNNTFYSAFKIGRHQYKPPSVNEFIAWGAGKDSYLSEDKLSNLTRWSASTTGIAIGSVTGAVGGAVAAVATNALWPIMATTVGGYTTKTAFLLTGGAAGGATGAAVAVIGAIVGTTAAIVIHEEGEKLHRDMIANHAPNSPFKRPATIDFSKLEEKLRNAVNGKPASRMPADSFSERYKKLYNDEISIPRQSAVTTIATLYNDLKNPLLSGYITDGFTSPDFQLPDVVVVRYSETSKLSRGVYQFNKEKSLWDKLTTYNSFTEKVFINTNGEVFLVRRSDLPVQILAPNSREVLRELDRPALGIANSGSHTYLIGTDNKLYSRKNDNGGWQVHFSYTHTIDVDEERKPWFGIHAGGLFGGHRAYGLETGVLDIGVGGGKRYAVDRKGRVFSFSNPAASNEYKGEFWGGWLEIPFDGKAEEVDADRYGGLWMRDDKGAVYTYLEKEWVKISPEGWLITSLSVH